MLRNDLCYRTPRHHSKNKQKDFLEPKEIKACLKKSDKAPYFVHTVYVDPCYLLLFFGFMIKNMPAKIKIHPKIFVAKIGSFNRNQPQNSDVNGSNRQNKEAIPEPIKRVPTCNNKVPPIDKALKAITETIANPLTVIEKLLEK